MNNGANKTPDDTVKEPRNTSLASPKKRYFNKWFIILYIILGLVIFLAAGFWVARQIPSGVERYTGVERELAEHALYLMDISEQLYIKMTIKEVKRVEHSSGGCKERADKDPDDPANFVVVSQERSLFGLVVNEFTYQGCKVSPSELTQ